MSDFKYQMNVPINDEVTVCDMATTFREFMRNLKKVPGRNLVVVPTEKAPVDKDKPTVADYIRIGEFVRSSNFVDLLPKGVDRVTEYSYTEDVEYWPVQFRVDTLVTPILTNENIDRAIETIRWIVSDKVINRQVNSVTVLLPTLNNKMRFKFRQNVASLAPIGVNDIYLVDNIRR